jgi:hypothetical protein
MTVYRVIANGQHVQALRHIRSSKNGWHRYCSIYESDGGPGLEFSSRRGYPCPTPMSAVLYEISMLSARMALLARLMRGKHADTWRSEIKSLDDRLQNALFLAMKISAEAGLMDARRAGTPAPPPPMRGVKRD